jgi:hypothetical protein
MLKITLEYLDEKPDFYEYDASDKTPDINKIEFTSDITHESTLGEYVFIFKNILASLGYEGLDDYFCLSGNFCETGCCCDEPTKIEPSDWEEKFFKTLEEKTDKNNDEPKVNDSEAGGR